MPPTSTASQWPSSSRASAFEKALTPPPRQPNTSSERAGSSFTRERASSAARRSRPSRASKPGRDRLGSARITGSGGAASLGLVASHAKAAWVSAGPPRATNRSKPITSSPIERSRAVAMLCPPLSTMCELRGTNFCARALIVTWSAVRPFAARAPTPTTTPSEEGERMTDPLGLLLNRRDFQPIRASRAPDS